MPDKPIPPTTWVPIGKLRSNPANPRTIQDARFRDLVRSIKEFPKMLLLRPLVVNAEMVVLGGNQRLAACKEAGLKKVPVLHAEDLSAEEQQRFIVVDNAPFGEWDMLSLVQHYEVADLNDWGVEIDLGNHDDDSTSAQGETDDDDEDGDLHSSTDAPHGTPDEGPGDTPTGKTQPDPHKHHLRITLNEVQHHQWEQLKDVLGYKRDTRALVRVLELFQGVGLRKLIKSGKQ